MHKSSASLVASLLVCAYGSGVEAQTIRAIAPLEGRMLFSAPAATARAAPPLSTIGTFAAASADAHGPVTPLAAEPVAVPAARSTDGHAYQPQALAAVLDRVSAAADAGQTPIVFFDLDDTLVNSGGRTLRILREFLAQAEIQTLYPGETQRLMSRLSLENMRFHFADTAKEAGISNETFVAQFAEFWSARFFRNDYLPEDPAYPGAVEFVNAVLARKGVVVYFTGRWEDMRPGTEIALRKNEFPEPDGRRVILAMKPDRHEPDDVFKARELPKLGALGQVVGGFENEPPNVNIFKRQFPSALMIFLNTGSTGQKDPATQRVIEVDPSIPWVGDFTLPSPTERARGAAFGLVRFGSMLSRKLTRGSWRPVFDGSAAANAAPETRPAVDESELGATTVPRGPRATGLAPLPRGPPSRPRGSRLDAVLDALNPFALYNHRILGVAHDRLAPDSFFQAPARGAIVGVNAVAGNELYRSASDFMTGAERTAGSAIRRGRASSPEGLISYLQSVYRENGPIERLVIAAHGSPGSLSIGGRSLNAAWARAHQALLASLPRDLFVPGAVIVLISCSVAGGFLWNPGYGRTALKEIFGPLLKQGGKVRASTRYVDPALGRIPPRYSGWGKRLARHFLAPIIALLETFFWLAGDLTSKLRKVVEIEIP